MRLPNWIYLRWKSLLAVLVLLLLCWGIYSQLIARPTVITVTGEGKIKAKPEQVSFTIDLVRPAADPVSALNSNNQLARTLINIARSTGVGEKDISVAYTQVVAPNALYGQKDYQAVNAIGITLKNVAALDTLVNQLYEGGASSVANIVFSTENSRELEKEAVALAIEDAHKRAKEIAGLMGKRVSKVVSVSTTEARASGAMVGEAPKAETFGGLLSNSPSQIEIVRTASVVYYLR